MSDRKLLKAPEVAARLNTSAARVQDLARQGILPSIALGRQRRFDPEAIERFISEGGQSLPGGWRMEPIEDPA